MTDREKLIALIKEGDCSSLTYGECSRCKYGCKGDCSYQFLADHLLANGVVVREWIPVTERLPEKNTTVIAATDNGIVFQCLYAYDGWDLWEGNEVNITHWMPLPEPPMRKGENG